LSDRAYLAHPTETAVVFLCGTACSRCYLGWLTAVATKDEHQVDCLPVKLPNGKVFAYADDKDALSIELERHARRLCFKYAQIIDLTDAPVRYGTTSL